MVTKMSVQPKINVIGGGMAGCEVAHMLAKLGLYVDLYEMRPVQKTEAHKTNSLAEIVCSNSLGSLAEESAPGVLKLEMSKLDSIILSCAKQNAVPAGRALGVDREAFAKQVTDTIESNERIRLHREEVKTLEEQEINIICTGPLTSQKLSEEIGKLIQQDSLYFYDSISPIVMSDSVDLDQAFFSSRYEEDQTDYLNCPLTRDQYYDFVKSVVEAEKVPVHNFEEMKCFEGCMPIEVLAERGPDTLRFGPMKPVGLKDPKTEKRPYAVVQLRRENSPTTMYNLVGFQSRMKWGAQKRVFSDDSGSKKRGIFENGFNASKHLHS